MLDVLQYFDAATAARFIKISTYVVAALFDPSVPPPGQFAIHNAIPGRKQLFVRQAGHFPYAAEVRENAELHARLWSWFSE